MVEVNPIQRYSALPIPSYAFLPGKHPHPRRDPTGHSYGKPEFPATPSRPEDWATTDLYLYGIDLFNHGFFWEAHEAWEALWNGTKKGTAHAEFLQALIRIAAARLKKRLSEDKGVTLHMEGARILLKSVKSQVGDSYMGLSLSGLEEKDSLCLTASL